MRTIKLRMDIVPHIDIWIWFSIVRSIHLTLPRSIVRDHLHHIMPFVERLRGIKQTGRSFCALCFSCQDNPVIEKYL